eukprot:1386533-Pyramimonas_sp.AAC.4
MDEVSAHAEPLAVTRPLLKKGVYAQPRDLDSRGEQTFGVYASKPKSLAENEREKNRATFRFAKPRRREKSDFEDCPLMDQPHTGRSLKAWHDIPATRARLERQVLVARLGSRHQST